MPDLIGHLITKDLRRHPLGVSIFLLGQGSEPVLISKEVMSPKNADPWYITPGKRGKTDILVCFGHRCTNNQPKFVASLMSGHPMSDMFQMARGVV